MRATRASPPFVALLFLCFIPSHAQHFLLCKPHGYEDCLAYSSKVFKDDLPKISGMVCGSIKKFGLTKLRDQTHKVEILGTGLRKTIFCKRIIYVKTVFGFKFLESLSDYLTPYQRTRRQATFTPRGRYRGQTQSQYLSIDRGNGKDEGKAEAQSAADSSRASVSGNSGMGQAQSQSIYDPNCDDCYGTPKHEIGTLRRQPDGINGYGPSTGPEYSSRYPAGSGYPEQSSHISPYSPGQTGFNGKPYVNDRFGPDGRNMPGTNGQNGGKYGPGAVDNGYGPGGRGNGYGPGGNGNGYGPGSNNKYGPQGTGSIYPDGSGFSPGKSIPSGRTGPNGSYGNGINPTPRLTESSDSSGRSIPSGSGTSDNIGPSTGNNYAPQQQSYPPSQNGGLSGSPVHDFNGQAKYPTQDDRNRQGQSGIGNYIPRPNGYIPGQTGNDYHIAQDGPNRSYNTPGSNNPNDKTYYNSGQNRIYTPDHRSREGYIPEGSSLVPGQLSTPTNQKLNPDNTRTDVGGYKQIPQQSPTDIANYRFPTGSYAPSQGNQANWPLASGPFHGSDGKTYICCEVPGMTGPGTTYGKNNVEGPNNLFAPGTQYGPGIQGSSRGGYSPEGAGSIKPSTLYSPGDISGPSGGQYGPGIANQPGGGSGTGSSQPGTGGPGNHYYSQNGPRKYGPDDTSGLRPGGQYGSGSTSPGYQYSVGGPGGQSSPDGKTEYVPGQPGQHRPGGGSGSLEGIPGRPYGSVSGPGVGVYLGGVPGTQYRPENRYGNGAGEPSQYGSGSGQNIPEGETGSVDRGPGNLYSPGTGSTGKYFPGAGGRVGLTSSGSPKGQYSPGRETDIGSSGQYNPEGGTGSGSGVPGVQYPPGSGQYIPGNDGSSGDAGLRGQYSPGSGMMTVSGGQYIPGSDNTPAGNQGGQYSTGSSPATGLGEHNIPENVGGPGTGSLGGQFSPGSGTAIRPGGQYIPGPGPGNPEGQYSARGGLDAQNIPDINIGPGYGPGTSSGGQYSPGSSGDPNRQYSSRTGPVGSGGQYYPGSGVSGGFYTPGSGTGHLGSKDPYGQTGQQYGLGSGIGSPGGQHISGGAGSGGGLPGGQYLPGGEEVGVQNEHNRRPGLVGGDGMGRYPSGQAGTEIEAGGTSNGYNSIPQNFVNPMSIADDDSEAEAVVSQAINGTTASASSKGGNDKGRAQTHVQGTYTGSGSFQAEAEIAGENKEAESAVSGGKKGASSSATGSGRNNKSQASVQLGSETGAVQTNSQSNGAMHSSNSQVQGSVKGGMADAQARGPGSTSSQAQIGFTPYKDDEKAKHDSQKIPFVGGGIASAQSSGRTGQSQSQLHGTFRYGITYNGAAQAGASLAKDAVFPNRLSFEKLDVFDVKNKNINVDLIESSPEPETEKIPETTPALPELAVEEQNEIEITTTEQSLDETLKDSESRYEVHSHGDHHKYETTPPGSILTDNRRSFHNNYYGTEYDTYTTDKDDNDDYDAEGAFIPDGQEGDQGAEYANYDEYRGDATHQSLQSPSKKEVEVRQTTGGNTQHIVLGSLKKHDAEITQKSSERPDEKKIYQPGESVPGTGGYTIPIGFTGSVKSVASKDKTYVVGSRDSPSQAQSVTLTPGTGKVRYTHPSNYGKYVHPTNLRSLNSKRNDDRYVSVSKSVTRDLDNDNNIRKQYSHTYYTKSSSCGYFTFTCTMVSSAEGKKKVCKPKIPTNPDGSPIRC